MDYLKATFDRIKAQPNYCQNCASQKNILVVVDAYKKRPFRLGSWMHLDLHKNQLIAKSMTWCFTDFSILGKSSHFTDYYIIYDSQKHFLFWKVQYICMVTNQLDNITRLYVVMKINGKMFYIDIAVISHMALIIKKYLK